MKKSKLLMVFLIVTIGVVIMSFTASAATEGYSYIVENGEATITDVDDTISGDVVIPDTLGGYPVTAIDYDAFYGCSELSEIHIPSSVSSIGTHTFALCTNLISISVDSDNNYYSDKNGVLFNKDKTELIRYPIGHERTEYFVPDSVTNIEDRSFYYCKNLKNINIPNSVINIGAHAFYHCENLKRIDIPSSVKVIEPWAFQSCTSLNELNISSDITDMYIGESAFDDTALVDVIIPNGVVELLLTFLVTDTLKNITILNPNTNIDYENTIPVHTVIYGYTNSTAQAYAEKYDRTFIPLDTCQHTASDWIITKEPTLTETGLKIKECIYCSDVLEFEVIPMLTLIEVSDDDFTLIYEPGAFDGEVEFEVREVTDGSITQTIAVRGYYDFVFYDINITLNGQKVQPNKNVWVKLPIPDNYDETKTAIYYVNGENSKPEKMNSYVKDGYIYFETNHFSHYVLVDESKKCENHSDNNQDGICDICDFDKKVGCTCKCHRTGIARFFWAIGNFFQKLFGKNKVCACGVAH